MQPLVYNLLHNDLLQIIVSYGHKTCRLPALVDKTLLKASAWGVESKFQYLRTAGY